MMFCVSYHSRLEVLVLCSSHAVMKLPHTMLVVPLLIEDVQPSRVAIRRELIVAGRGVPEGAWDVRQMEEPDGIFTPDDIETEQDQECRDEGHGRPLTTAVGSLAIHGAVRQVAPHQFSHDDGRPKHPRLRLSEVRGTIDLHACVQSPVRH